MLNEFLTSVKLLGGRCNLKIKMRVAHIFFSGVQKGVSVFRGAWARVAWVCQSTRLEINYTLLIIVFRQGHM